MSNILLDTFNGTLGELVSAHTIDTAGAVFTTSYGGDPLLDGTNRVKVNPAASGYGVYEVTPPSADYNVDATFTFLDVQTDQDFHLASRIAVSGDRIALIYQASSNSLNLYVYVSNSPTSVGSQVSFTPIAGTQYTFTVRAIGTTLSVYQDGVLKITGTNSSLSAAGWPGFLIAGANTDTTGIRLSNFRSYPIASTVSFSSASVPTTGEKVALVASASISSLLLADFRAVANGLPLSLASVSGSGTAWALKLNESFITAGQTVKVSYIGSAAINVSLTATNSSTVPLQIGRYNGKGLGAFLTFGAATFASAVDPVLQSAANTWFTPTSYDMDTILDGAQAMGARYAMFTAKHGAAFCLWPTSSGAPNIGPTPWYASNHIDIVGDYVAKCRARGLGVGLYLNFYDSWFTSTRSGHNGTYTNTGPTFTAYISQQITELLTNYGTIDYLWLDSWGYLVGYTVTPYATIRALVTSLQPNCILINNSHDAVIDKLTHSDIAEYEEDEGLSPDASTIAASEFCMPSRADGSWVWLTSGDTYIAPATAAAKLQTLNGFHCNFLLNINPNDQGILSTNQSAFCAALGAMIGTQGGTLLPIPQHVAAGVDRGDGVLGTFGGSGGGGINGTGILGMV